MKDKQTKIILGVLLVLVLICLIAVLAASALLTIFPRDRSEKSEVTTTVIVEEDDTTTDDNGFACEQSPDGASVSHEEAVEIVRALPEVQAFISLINTKGDSEAYIEYSHDECNTYSIHVYELKDDHTATFNWYDVNMYTGEVTTMVDF